MVAPYPRVRPVYSSLQQERAHNTPPIYRSQHITQNRQNIFTNSEKSISNGQIRFGSFKENNFGQKFEESIHNRGPPDATIEDQIGKYGERADQHIRQNYNNERFTSQNIRNLRPERSPYQTQRETELKRVSSQENRQNREQQANFYRKRENRSETNTHFHQNNKNQFDRHPYQNHREKQQNFVTSKQQFQKRSSQINLPGQNKNEIGNHRNFNNSSDLSSENGNVVDYYQNKAKHSQQINGYTNKKQEDQERFMKNDQQNEVYHFPSD